MVRRLCSAFKYRRNLVIYYNNLSFKFFNKRRIQLSQNNVVDRWRDGLNEAFFTSLKINTALGL